MRTSAALLALALVLTALSSCARHTEPVGPPQQLTAEQRNFEAIWQASRHVLLKYSFELDSEDRRAGLMLTRPMTGKCVAEFWRHDAATGQALAESTVQTIYRQAKVTITPVGGDPKTFQADVEIRTRRSDLPEMQISNVTDAIDLFKLSGSANKRPQPLESGGEEPSGQVDLGRDADLERNIATEIQAATPEYLSRT